MSELDLTKVHNQKVSEVFDLNGNTFIIGVSNASQLDSLVLYRVKPDNSLSASFWYEISAIKDKGLTMLEFINKALEYFTGCVQRYFNGETEPQDIYDQLADAVTNIKWNSAEHKFYYEE